MEAIDEALIEAASRADTERVRELLAEGADASSGEPYTALSLLLESGTYRPALIAELLDAGADVDTASWEHGVTALMQAADRDDVDLASDLVARGADLEQTDRLSGETALMRAAKSGSARVVDLLLEAPVAAADGRAVASDVDAARPYGEVIGPDRLRDVHAELFVACCRTGRLDDARALLGGPLAPASDALFERAWSAALAYARADAAAFLEDRDEDLLERIDLDEALLRAIPAFGSAPSSWGDELDYDRLPEAVANVRRLLELGADANARARTGDGPLHRVARYVYADGARELVDLLVSHGADLEAMGPGSTPLMVAAQYGNAPVVAALLDAGASPLRVDAAGRGVVAYARRDKTVPAVVELLVSHGAVEEAWPEGSESPDALALRDHLRMWGFLLVVLAVAVVALFFVFR